MATNITQQSSYHLSFDKLMMNTHFIRNICILAHVDHGKTTFADSLIASNGIISTRDVGKLNYMDFREDEQIKRITMKSSAISLVYSPKYNPFDHFFLINLIDSPGHIDFSAEVSTAVRLSDGAFLIIDVVEGICPQTRSVIKQIFLEHLSPCLVFNKIDKLFLKLNLTSTEAYNHLYQLLEQVNALMASFETLMAFHSKAYDESIVQDDNENIKEFNTFIGTDCNSFFTPLKGNVIFTSSFDGWGFKLDNFVHILSDQLGYSKKVLSKTLWGDYFFNSKNLRILPNAKTKDKKPLFASFILDSIWSVYKFSIVSKDITKITSIIQKLKLDISMRLLKHSDNRLILQSIMQQWLPLSDAALSMAIDNIPGPQNLSDFRIERFFINNLFQEFEILPPEIKSLKQYFKKCISLDDIPQVTFVSKMMPFPKESLQWFNINEKNSFSDYEQKETNNTCLLAFARVITGTIRSGQTLYVLHPRYDPTQNLMTKEDSLQVPGSKSHYVPQNVSIVKTGDLYIFMGKELKPVQFVPAGNICGISGLDNVVLRNCTLSNTLSCIPFCPIYIDSNPILKVSLEPIHISDMESLANGLELLSKVDPCVEIGVEETGEHVISCAGEVHLKKCIEDLKTYFALNIDFDVSPPIIPFRETIKDIEDHPTSNETIEENDDKTKILTNQSNPDLCGCVCNKTPKKEFEITIRAYPLPVSVVQCLEQNFNLLKFIDSINNRRDKKQSNIAGNVMQEFIALRKNLKSLFQNAGKIVENIVDRIWSFGSKTNCPNILINNAEGYNRISIWPDLNSDKLGDEFCHMHLDSSVIQGFQLATLQGPLCNEPIFGVCFIVESLKFESLIGRQESIDMLEYKKINNMPYGPLSGQVISIVTKTCKQAFLAQPTRLMYPIYSCSLQCTQEALGSMNAVINRRGGKCVYQEVEIGTNNFIIDSYIPVIGSFGFCDEIRKKTSGLAIPQLIFSHWEIIQSDPFWVPSTAEELLHFGVKADSENVAKKYMDNIRKRKGLPIHSKLVEYGEKQRNIKK